jgi:Ser/Thr protein kinase RdoA (MazF antagonist)
VTSSSPAAAYASFTIDHAEGVLQHALERVGLRGIDQFRPLRTPADNVVIHVPQLDMVARIAVDPSHRERLARELSTASWLADHDIPSVVPASPPPTPQLEVLEGRVISWWEYLPSTQEGSLHELGALLRRMHTSPVPSSLARLDPWARVDHQIAAAAAVLPATDIDLLMRERRRLAERWHASGWGRSPISAIHGDAYTGNTLVVDGQAHLLDFEDAAIGPPQWDFASVLGAHQLGWIDSSGYHDFCRGYDADLQDLPNIDVLVDIILFRRCCWFASRAGREQGIIDAVRHRIGTLTLPHHRKRWRRGGS